MPTKQKKILKDKLISYFSRFNLMGLVFAVIFFCLSLLPSLLPRPWVFQGLISGISIVTGYAIGTMFSSVVRWFVQKELPRKYKTYVWRTFFVLAPIVVFVYLYLGASWQNQTKELVGEAPTAGRHMFRVLIISILVGWLLLLIARGIRIISKYVINYINKYLPKRLSIAIGLVLIILVGYWLINGLIFSAFVNISNSIYANTNNQTIAGISQPTSSTRSGSPESLISWESLGSQGRTFVASGANQTQLESFTKSTPKEQIRIYAGLQSAPDTKSRAQLALQELERTNAFSRKVLVVATATGTGWLEPQSVDSIEYMYGGDTAIVSQQYSYLPSWISFLVDKQKATDTGKELFDVVYGKWASLPKDQRPKLIVYGLSLGSFGGQSAFSGVNDIKFRTDGALFMGTPSDTSLWMNITESREKGSPEWQPIYENGKTVRFAATNANITDNQENWTFPRALYMQHASDPVVWFNFNLVFNEPDWLREPRGPDVSPNMRWYPFVTFFQVTVDQFFGVSVPNGHGHNYPNTIVNSWGSIVPPESWSVEKAKQLQDIINTYSNT